MLGAALAALVIAGGAFAFYGLATAQEDEADENRVTAQQDAPPGCYREPSAGNIVVCPSVSISASPADITVGDSGTLKWIRSRWITSQSINNGIGSVTGGSSFLSSGYGPVIS